MNPNPFRGRMRRPSHTRSRQLLVERMLLNLRSFEDEDAFDYYVQSQVPKAWDTLEQDVDVWEKKEKVTLYLDGSVAKFYRAMGQGYQARINRILATFAQMRIAQIRRLEDMLAEEVAKVDELRE